MDKRYSLPAELMQAVVNTLGSLPWGQVNTLMTAVQRELSQQDATPPLPDLPNS